MPCKNDVEMMILINSEELEEKTLVVMKMMITRVTLLEHLPLNHILLIRTPWYIIGLVVLVTGVVATQSISYTSTI